MKKYAGISEKQISNIIKGMPINTELQKAFTNKAPLIPIIAERVMERVQIDLIDKSSDACHHDGKVYRYILSVVDVMSRYCWARPIQQKSSALVAAALKDIFDTYGDPSIVQNDKGKEFEGEVAKFLKLRSIKHVKSSPYHPQSQGKVERSHRTLKSILGFDIIKTKSLNWVNGLEDNIILVNQRRKRVLGNHSPFEIFYGRFKTISTSKQFTPDELHQKARESTSQYNERMIKRQEKTLKTPEYNNFDRVLVRIPSKKSRVTSKQVCRKGVIIDCNTAIYKYKVLYKDSNGKNKQAWFSVKDITAFTKKQQKHSEMTASLMSPLTHDSRIHNLQSENGLGIVYDPVGDGNCLFRAIAFQLNNNHSTHETLRADVVNYLLRHPYLAQQQGNIWHQHLVDITAPEYLVSMSRDGTYGDHIVVQALAELLNTQILILSTNTAANVLIRPDGSNTFEPNQPFLVLGHLPENHGEHYVALEQDLGSVLPIVFRSPQIQTESCVTVSPLQCAEPSVPAAPALNSSEQNVAAADSSADVRCNMELFGLPVEILTKIFTMIVGNSLEVYSMLVGMVELRAFMVSYVKRPIPTLLSLPNVILQMLLKSCVNQDLLTYCMVKSMPEFSNHLAVPKPKETVYLNADVENTLNPLKLKAVSVSVRAIIRASGSGSGLMAEVKRVLGGNTKWINAWLELVAGRHGWYTIKNIFWKKM